ncbi:MAG: hypothetical protein M3552_19740 [Planctomycetota bacterium]|nr:hypothetical protein [Planctomycetaceae bacterium]MDQ3332850.1 hypothetical protein [Planctomycetota bacterium]
MSETFVTVATFTTLPEAEAAKLHLQSEGIPVNIVDAEIVNMDWLLGNAVGYIKLQVPESRAEAAAALIELIAVERRRRRAAREADEDDGRDAADDQQCLACGTEMCDTDACPKCGWSWAEN